MPEAGRVPEAVPGPAAELLVPGRGFFERDPVLLAPLLLGAVLAYDGEGGRVAVRLSELEAYRGPGEDPGSHSFRGRTPRNDVMFGEPAHLYAYFSYGMHTCLNIVTRPTGSAAGILMRGGTIVEGVELARSRRAGARERDLARGPGRLAKALGVPLAAKGADLLAPPFELRVPTRPLAHAAGPRTGVSGPGGGAAYPWRFWIPGDPGVSPYKRHANADD